MSLSSRPDVNGRARTPRAAILGERAARHNPARETRRRPCAQRYRTTPLRGLTTHPPYFHDGSAATLSDVVAHYDRVLKLGLSDQQKSNLVEYLKSL